MGPWGLGVGEIMANYAKWNVRKRHEWLAKPLKAKRLKRCQKARVGILDAEARKAKPEPQADAAAAG